MFHGGVGSREDRMGAFRQEDTQVHAIDVIMQAKRKKKKAKLKKGRLSMKCQPLRIYSRNKLRSQIARLYVMEIWASRSICIEC